MPLPVNHPLRFELNDEVHARPPEALSPPCRIGFLAVMPKLDQRQAEWQHVADLCRTHNIEPPRQDANHFAVDFGNFRFTWERHTEFTRYKFITPNAGEELFTGPWVAPAMQGWIDGLLGETLVAARVELRPAADRNLDAEAISKDYFSGNPVIGSAMSGRAATGFTDFRIRDDGFSRVLVLDHGLTPRQAGRIVQRILEIDTYRMLALLAFPVARGLGPFLSQHERELAEITSVMTEGGIAQEQALLERLTRLEATIEDRFVNNYYRFNASGAYYELVQRRIAELREERIPGLQTFQEFTERRLAPAMTTCRTMEARIEALSDRVSRSSQLLTTRVAIERERQNQNLLEALANRARLQLRLQQTVEGLSIAAVTYYVVGLVGYLVKGFKSAFHGLEPEFVIALSVPFVALAVAYGLHNVRKGLELEKEH